MLTTRLLSHARTCHRCLSHLQHTQQRRSLRAYAVGSAESPAMSREVLTYWFDEQFPDWPHDKLDAQKYMSRWFMGGEEVDAEIKEKFGAQVEAMRSGEHDSWKDEPMSCLAGIVLMDQFTRNAYRDTPQMYSADEKAREWAAHFASCSGYKAVHPAGKFVASLPFMHGETLESQQKCLDLINAEIKALEAQYGPDTESGKMLGNSAGFAQKHYDIIAKYGRFPHRNNLLGRESTAEEKKGLEDGSIDSF